MVPDKRWERVGTTPWGQQLYREVQKRARAVALYNEDGTRAYTKAPNGMELVPKNRPHLYDYERTFYLQSEGNGNVSRQPYRPPTPEEIAQAEREGKIEQMQRQLAESFVDADISPEALIQALKERPYTPQSELEEDEDEDPFIEPSAETIAAAEERYRQEQGETPAEPEVDVATDEPEGTDDEPVEPDDELPPPGEGDDL
jgi:hypothetical protein